MVVLKITNSAQAFQQNIKKENPVKPYEDIAEGMEANFTRMMLNEMRKTVAKESPDTPAMDYYNGLMDAERAELMAKSDSGLGVKKIILDQIVPNHMKQYLKKTTTENRQTMTNSTKENSHE